ncbi:MAG: hypothetical protein LWW85_11125 [Marinilabiliales bacterium]|nr:hypothetical protein [Marinilabiliales bacterium]
MKNFVPSILTVLLLAATGCDEKEVKQISKEGAVETALSVDHLDEQHDLIVTTHKIWIKNQLVKTIVYKDTVPTLGMTEQPGETANGDTARVRLKRDYELYITVK